MKNIALTFAYLKKHFWLPIAAMALPAIVACFLSTPYWEVAFVAGFDYDPYISVGQTFSLMFGDSWQYLWPVVIIAGLQSVAAALIMSCVDRHFRTGRLSLRSPLPMINNSLFAILLGVIVMSVFSIIWRFVLFGLVSLLQFIGQSAHFPSGVTLALISAVAVGFFILHVIIITPVMFWAPIMFIYGYGFRDAAATSFKLLAGKRMYMGLLLPMLLCAGVQLLVGFLGVHAVVSVIISFVIFLVTNAYATTYTMVTFYDVGDLERRDVKPYSRFRIDLPPRREEQPEKQPAPDADKVQEPVEQAADAQQKNSTKKSNGAKKPSNAKKQSAKSQKQTKQAVSDKPAKQPKKKSSTKQKSGDTQASADTSVGDLIPTPSASANDGGENVA